MRLCDVELSEFSDVCARETWGAILPAAAILIIALFKFINSPALSRVFGPFVGVWKTYMTLEEAEALEATETDTDATKNVSPVSTSAAPQTILFVLLGLAEALAWLSIGSYRFIINPTDIRHGTRAMFIALPWLYTALRPVIRPTHTPPFDLFILYCVQTIAATLQLGGMLFEKEVYGAPLPGAFAIAGHAVHLSVVLVLLISMLVMPLATPSARVKKEDIGHSVSPEDYTTIWEWATFSWVYPLLKRGRTSTLQEDDVWNLSPTIQSRPIFIKFSSIARNSLLARLWHANSLDILLDSGLNFISIAFNYANPFFLRKILASIEQPDAGRAERSRAYTYAFLMFLCALGKAQIDLQHLWFSRRASGRLRSELMASIYDKALKRKDYSGIVSKDKQEEVRPANEKGKKKTKAEKEKEEKADDAKAGADVGKIVNLMAGDANRLSNTLTGLMFITGAPLELIIGCTFLYQLMGLSAFVGFVVLIAGWPFNSYLAKRSIRINKGTLAARDKRMGVLNELIGAVKFIKFFAWEDKWIERVLDAREKEMQWMVKARINSVLFYALWISAPILVSIISFFSYVYMGNQLTISVAFTAIALFNMIRTPLNVIPVWIVNLMQAGVALNRISVYLGEEEVSAQVSVLKRPVLRESRLAGELEGEGIGLRNATLQWNEVLADAADDKTKVSEASASSTQSDSATEVGSVNGDGDHKFELRDITVRFPERALTLVTGPTASGKTALLMALLGEMTLVDGEVVLNKDSSIVDEHGLMHSISYAAQSPWLQHRSIKDNILFGYPLDEQRYNDVLEACALKPDLDVLEDGDATEIGVRGVSLSGGQKARVALARAVYARTRYVLLDDPLSAVDSHTSRTLFDKLLCGPLLANRTVVLVTHHVELVLPGAEYLVRMLDGRIDTQGYVKDLKSQGILEDIAHDSAVDAHKEDLVVAEAQAVEDAVPADEDTKDTKTKKPRKLIKDEHREEGGVKWHIYKRYLKASSYHIWAFLFFLIILSQLVGLVEKVWMMIWGAAYTQGHGDESHLQHFVHAMKSSSLNEHHQAPLHAFAPLVHYLYTDKPVHYGWLTLPNPNEHPMFYIGVYSLIGAVSVLVSLSSAAAQYTAALRASRILFRQLLETVVRATFRFHDTTPQGRMLNRFGKDIETIDTSLASSLQSVNSSFASFLTSIVTVGVVFPLFILPASVFGYFYRELAISYLNTGRDLRRMESNTRSPIFSDFGELLEGIVTVRAFGAERRFLDNLHKKIDVTTKMWYAFWMTNRWLLYNFDSLSALGVFITSVLSIASAKGAGVAGLCITSALSFTVSMYWTCRFWTGLELDLNSVERVVEYLELPQEPPMVIESNRPPAYWPSSSSDSLIVVEDLEVRYAPDLPAVLEKISFTLKAGERVGLLGRTGSGKSTLAMSLLRFVDPSGGRILVDGVDISKIGIHDLRSRITFIPQDATLFSGTLRENLDPFNEHEDSECWDALHRVQMITDNQLASSRRTSRQASAVTSPTGSIHEAPIEAAHVLDTSDATTSGSRTPNSTAATVTLDTNVSSGGNNFSQGQRQLIAMARALLRSSSIIVLDEATSSIDFATDAKIQATIREEFGGSLLLTVAHRLRTVIDYDRLVVLDKGRVVEIDTPWNLIQKDGGIFREMCLRSGTFAELENVAKAKAQA